MPPSSRSAVREAATEPPKWVDLDPPLRNSDRLVAVFSQCQYDGRITFSIHREFDKFNPSSRSKENSKTAFIPEQLTASYASMVTLAIRHIDALKEKRKAGLLPFPEGGVQP